MAVAALPPGKKSPIDSMRSNFRGLKNNIKSMSKTVLGIQTALQKAKLIHKRYLQRKIKVLISMNMSKA